MPRASYTFRDKELSRAPLTPEECRQVREYLRDEERARWFWASVRIWLKWAAAVPATIMAIYLLYKELWIGK